MLQIEISEDIRVARRTRLTWNEEKKNQCSHITDQVLPNTEINITLCETFKRNDAIIRVMHTKLEDESYNFFKFRSVMIYNRLQQIFLCLGGFAVSFSSSLSKYP